MVSQQGEGESAGGTGPLAEIQSWHRRGDDLAGICAQLDSPGESHDISHVTLQFLMITLNIAAIPCLASYADNLAP